MILLYHKYRLKHSLIERIEYNRSMLKRIPFFSVLITSVLVAVFFLLKDSKIPKTLPQNSNQSSPIISNNRKSAGEIPNINFSLPPDYEVRVFAKGLGKPRDLTLSPGGTLLVSDINRDRVIALPDKNGDGAADEVKVVADVSGVHGLAFYKDKLYVANVTSVVRYNWNDESLTAVRDREIVSLPQTSLHSSRTIAFSPTGQMFVVLGSTCNVCDEDTSRAGSVVTVSSEGGSSKVFATGLRNAAFLATNPTTGELWGIEMGRDNLGDDIPPDEVNIIREGKNYGWPNCYGNRVQDKDFDTGSNSCGNTIPPIFEIPAHSAPLGLIFIDSQQFPSNWQGDLFVAYHGSWNRSSPAGFKVVRLNVVGNTITSSEDFLTGFLEGDNADSALARPVDLAFDQQGNLYLSDDKSGNIFIIQKK